MSGSKTDPAQPPADPAAVLDGFLRLLGMPGTTLNGLGEAAHTAGRHADALTHHTAAHTIAVDIGDRDQQARAHTGLGHTHHTLGNSARARQQYQHALTLYTHLGMPDADQIRAYITIEDRSHEQR
jgi:Flp pilus assembly protein TadD